MTDMLLELSQNALARNLVSRAKLPIPLPEKLERPDGPSIERFLEGKSVLITGQGALAKTVARVLARAGASALLETESLLETFAGPGEAYGRHPRVVDPGALDGEHIDAVVFDATGLGNAQQLKQLWQSLHAVVPALGHHGRVVVLGRPPQRARTLEAAAAAAALEGFTRSLAKEIGGKAATANLIYVDEGAEDRLSAPLRYLLSKASAFVTAQPLRVTAEASWDAQDPWTQPLADKVALVTGAAQGIGEATARVLAAEGAHVVCLDRPDDDAALSVVARDVGGSLLLCDVRDPAAPRIVAGHLQEKHGGVDIVVHNAGVTRDRTLARMNEQQWDQVLGVNLEAILRITSALLEGALHDGGRIVSLSSIAGIAGNNGQTNYGASKAGVIGFTRYLAGQVARRGITVNAVAPGFIETRMTAAVPVVVREVGRRLAALGQGGQPEDVAHAIAFLAQPGSAGVTGNVLRVCGGALLGA
jgi:3-oxoacyl-[acyl-carrier protein] reductase